MHREGLSLREFSFHLLLRPLMQEACFPSLFPWAVSVSIGVFFLTCQMPGHWWCWLDRTLRCLSKLSSAGGISAISLRASPFVWRNSVNKATSRFVFFTVFWFSCSSIKVLMEPSKEANLELAMLDSRVGAKLAGHDCALVNFRRSRLWLGERRFFTSENSSFAFPIG